MAVRERLTPDQVASLLTGSPVAPSAPVAPSTPAKPYRPRYGSCDRCGDIQPGLLTFHGDHDWEPELPADSPVRDLVRVLREHRDRRTILLCSHCVDVVRAQPTAVPPTPPALFDVED